MDQFVHQKLKMPIKCFNATRYYLLLRFVGEKINSAR